MSSSVREGGVRWYSRGHALGSVTGSSMFTCFGPLRIGLLAREGNTSRGRIVASSRKADLAGIKETSSSTSIIIRHSNPIPSSSLPFPEFRIDSGFISPSIVPFARFSPSPFPSTHAICQAPVIAWNPSVRGSLPKRKCSFCGIASVSVGTQAQSPSPRRLLPPTLATPFHRARTCMLQHLGATPYLLAHR
jgi:hypothetical protein